MTAKPFKKLKKSLKKYTEKGKLEETRKKIKKPPSSANKIERMRTIFSKAGKSAEHNLAIHSIVFVHRVSQISENRFDTNIHVEQ
jgi:hypothetical protein